MAVESAAPTMPSRGMRIRFDVAFTASATPAAMMLTCCLFRLVKFRPEQEFERTIYLPVVRVGSQKGPAELRDVFDFTQPTEMAGCRAVTAVPTQALFLMNARMIKDRARDLAQRILADADDEHARLDKLWLTALNRPILSEERADAAAFLADTIAHNGHTQPGDAQAAAWAELCHELLASNEFLMRF